MTEITMPTALWQKLEEIAERIGGLDAKVDSCITGIGEAKDYQKVQNGNLARAVAEVTQLKETAAGSLAEREAERSYRSDQNGKLRTAEGEVAELKLAAATESGRRQGISLTWNWIAVYAGIALSLGALLFHMIFE